jgi:hypothetical protein
MIAVSQKSWHYWFADAAGISMKTVGGGEVNLCTYVSHVGFGIVIVCSALALTSLAVFAAYLLVAAGLAGAMYILNGFPPTDNGTRSYWCPHVAMRNSWRHCVGADQVW